MKKIFLLLVSLLFTYTILTAQVSFTASAPQAVEAGEQFRLVFNLNAQGQNFRAPDLSAFDAMGPISSTQMSVSNVNGKMSQEYSISYTFVMTPKKTGKFTIGSAQVSIGGKTYKSNPLTIEVVGSGNAKQSNSNQKESNSSVSDGGNKDIFAAISLSKSSVYQGEHIVATIKIYTRLDLVGFDQVKFPSYNGFFTQDIQTSENISLQRENVNGTLYNVGVIKRTLLFPQRTGEITIDPCTVECVVRMNTGQRSFWGPVTQNVKKSLKSSPVKVKVNALPSQPAKFSGGVGTFTMQTTLDKKSLKTNDAMSLKIKISGSGNLKLIDPLKVEFPTDFEVYDPKTESNVNNSVAGASGTKTFEYVAIPRHAGTFKIPAVQFVYFDTQKGTYKTLSSEEFTINVEKGAGGEGNATVVSGNKEDVKLIGSDIRFIKINDFKLKSKGYLLFGSFLFYLLYLIPLILFVVLFIVRRKQIRENTNLVLVKNKQANKVSRKRLKLAESYLKTNKKQEFYSEVLKALWGYLSDKLSIPVSELSRENATTTLSQRNVDTDTLNQLVSILDTCEFAQYAPISDESQMDKVFVQAGEIIGKLESNLK